MGKMKKMSDAERKRKKKECEQRRRDKIKANPTLLLKQKHKEQERYIKKKQRGIVKPVAMLPLRDQRKQRKSWRANQKNSRERKKRDGNLRDILQTNTPPSSEDEDENDIIGPYPVDPSLVEPSTSTRRNSNASIVSNGSFVLPSQGVSRCSAGRKRIRRDRSKLVRDNASLKQKILDLQRLTSKYKKRLQRAQYMPTKSDSLSTPRSRVRFLIGKNKVSPEVKRKLLLGAVMEDQVQEGMKTLTDEHSKRLITRVFSAGSFMKKYKFLKNCPFLTYKKIWADAKRLKTSLVLTRKKRLAELQDKIRKDVEIFLEEDCNSRMCPGKNDTITKNKEKKQKRLLTNTLKCLYEKFNRAQSYRISYTKFCAMKPFWIVQPKVTERETCSCVTCCNFQLIISKLHQLHVLEENTMSKLMKQICCSAPMDNEEDCLMRNCAICVDKQIPYLEFDMFQAASYKKWKTVKESYVDKKGATKFSVKTKIIDETCTVGDIVNLLEESTKKFMTHNANKIHQYKAMKGAKDNLTNHDIVIHIDFSENYCCKYGTEVQSLHFGGSRQQITLHTGVFYYKEEDAIKCESFCSMSESLNHGPPGIWAHLEPVLKSISERFPEVNTVHFLSDSPATQYRNKIMFHFIAKHLKSSFPALQSCTWNYSESGHGKGAPDGIGGVIKRTADRLVAMGNDIPNYEMFQTVMTSTQETIKLYSISCASIEEKEMIFQADHSDIKAFVGTMKVHQVSYDATTHFNDFRTLSCFKCTAGQVCPHYSLGHRDLTTTQLPQQRAIGTSQIVQGVDKNTEDLIIGSWVAVEYDNVEYPGEIIKISGDEVYVNAMEPTTGHRFKWPECKNDKCWYNRSNVKRKISNPSPCDNRMSRFTFSDFPSINM